jgi:hypothetical protein
MYITTAAYATNTNWNLCSYRKKRHNKNWALSNRIEKHPPFKFAQRDKGGAPYSLRLNEGEMNGLILSSLIAFR